MCVLSRVRARAHARVCLCVCVYVCARARVRMCVSVWVWVLVWACRCGRVPTSAARNAPGRLLPDPPGQVQCGVARTGRWWGHQHLTEVQPDLLLFAKGIASGVPFAGVSARPELYSRMSQGMMVSARLYANALGMFRFLSPHLCRGLGASERLQSQMTYDLGCRYLPQGHFISCPRALRLVPCMLAACSTRPG